MPSVDPTTHSLLLEHAASNNLHAFQTLLQSSPSTSPDAPSPWYCRSISSLRFSFSDRTPLMVASLYSSLDILQFLLTHHHPTSIDINRRSASDGATALALASPESSTLLLAAGAVPENPKPSKKEYPVDLTMPDINEGLYKTDDFRIYCFKVKPCSRAYSHDWTECPFVHPGENARRRDLRKHAYSCVPCPEFRKGSCRKGDGCEFAHGVFESWLHPMQYRTRLCKDEVGCNRRVCFFAHRVQELRQPRNDLRMISLNCCSFSPPSFGLDQAILNAKYAKRSQSFNYGNAGTKSMGLADWGSPNGKVDWGVQREELNRFRKSASFAIRSDLSGYDEPDFDVFNPWGEEQMVA